MAHQTLCKQGRGYVYKYEGIPRLFLSAYPD